MRSERDGAQHITDRDGRRFLMIFAVLGSIIGATVVGLGALVLFTENRLTALVRGDAEDGTRVGKGENGDTLGMGSDVLVSSQSEISRNDPSLFVTPSDWKPYSEGWVDDSGSSVAIRFSGPTENTSSLSDVAKSLRDRADRGLQFHGEQLAQAPPDDPTFKNPTARLQRILGLLHMYDGDFEAAAAMFETAKETALPGAVFFRDNMHALLGVAALRQGELDNCVDCCNEASCLFPLAVEAQHAFPEGSSKAIEHFLAYLEARPDDLGIQWLLNVAAMTIGRYPDGVPEPYRMKLDSFESDRDVATFPNITTLVGLAARGPNMAGGCIVDDFDGDGLLDVFYSTYDPTMGAALFINQGNGSFIDRSESAGLTDQIGALNAVETDFNNDGLPDVLLTRGGWEGALRLSLLRNEGGRFSDVTIDAGLVEPIATQAAAWADYDLDGHVDLYVAGEYYGSQPDPRNRSRLYHNQGDGTFEEVGALAGVLNYRFGKGAAWGDFDDDGDPDLYVTNLGQPNRLYMNQGDGTFVDIADVTNLQGPMQAFACWWWDFDNDGLLDLYANGYGSSLTEVVRSQLLGESGVGEAPALYRNLGGGVFQDVTQEVGLDRAMMPMGANFGDLDNDGWLDFYLGTGTPLYSFLTPNVLFRNDQGIRFEDVTTAANVGHLQKGHGVAFADWDRDGDQDIFIEAGGATPGDKAHNLLFQNPGHGNHWLYLKLLGQQSNRSAIGAKIRLVVQEPDGETRSLYRVVGATSSFGGNGFPMTIGLGNATAIESLRIQWPIRDSEPQIINNLPLDSAVTITEGQDVPTIEQWSALPSP